MFGIYKALGVAALVALFGMSTAPASAATFHGEFWDVETNEIQNLNAVLGIVEGPGKRAADATFKSTGIDYPQGSQSGQTSQNLSSWLGTDNATLSGFGDEPMLGSIFRFTGSIFLDAGDNFLSVGSDDGYRLSIEGGSFVNEDGSPEGSSKSVSLTRPFGTDNYIFNTGAAGAKSFELIFYENKSSAVGVQFKKDGEVVAPVPLPAAGLMLLGGLGGLAALRRRKRTA